MKQRNGPAGAHIGLFGRSTIHMAPEGDGGGSGPSIADRLAALEARTASSAPAAAQPSTVTPAFDYDQLAAAITRAQPQPVAAPPPAMGPRAPNGPASPSHHQGLTDPFQLDARQIEQLGPRGMRDLFETILKVGRDQAGVPTRPRPGKRS